jgi:hypothetical protein
VLTVVGGIPAWSTPASGGVTTISFGSTGLTPSTATSGAVSVAGTLAATNGGTGQSTYAVGDLLQGGATNTLTKLAAVATGNALISGGVTTASSWGKIGLTTHVSGTLPVGNGGLGITTTPTNGQIPIGNGTNYVASTLTAGTGITIANTSGAITISSSGGGTGTPPINRFYTTTGATYTPTANLKYAVVYVAGGGGGGGGNATGNYIGTGQAGQAGQASSFGSLITANGGGGGNGATISPGSRTAGNGGAVGNTTFGAGASALQGANSGQNTNSTIGTLSYAGGVASAGSAGALDGESAANAGGGGQGGFATALMQATTIGASVAITVGGAGAGGAGVSPVPSGGNPGSPGAGGQVRVTEFFG